MCDNAVSSPLHYILYPSTATVSRAGILYINDTDIGWRPFVETWRAGLEMEALRAHLPGE